MAGAAVPLTVPGSHPRVGRRSAARRRATYRGMMQDRDRTMPDRYGTQDGCAMDGSGMGGVAGRRAAGATEVRHGS
ncbi:hypothetical protein GCM10009864_07040 [Streptomyces lunalinharesii]|uniref:Uncharacterized protein n=1 Tax=Streptomyces lunalinharesii TaxID=333384 RepID=A0ABP6DLA5_9ACTN